MGSSINLAIRVKELTFNKVSDIIILGEDQQNEAVIRNGLCDVKHQGTLVSCTAIS